MRQNIKKTIEDMQEDDKILCLAHEQLKIINENFKDLKNLEKAFEDFGLGILYDTHHDYMRTAT